MMRTLHRNLGRYQSKGWISHLARRLWEGKEVVASDDMLGALLGSEVNLRPTADRDDKLLRRERSLVHNPG